MKHLFFLAAMCLIIQLASAHTPPQSAQPDLLGLVLPTPPAAPDTVAALHRLFAAKRKKLAFILLGTVTAEIAGQVVIGATVHGGTGAVNERAVDHFFAVLLAVPVVLAEVLFYARYNQKHEQQALAQQRAHQLPPHLKRQLKATYFH